MAKRKLADTVRKVPPRKSALDEADQLLAQAAAPGTGTVRPAPIRRHTERLSISLLRQERKELEHRIGQLWASGHSDIKISRLARIAFRMLLRATDEDIVELAEEVPDLQKRST